MPIQIMTVDDHAVVRAGIVAVLNDERDFTVVAEARDGREALAHYAEHRADVVLMDLRMPRMDGVSATRALRAVDPRACVVALTMYEGDTDIHRALSAGASGYLLKGAPAAEIVEAVRRAAAGRRVIPAPVARALAEFTPRVDLTEREVEVLRLAGQGLRNAEIARLIGRTVATVKVHLRNVYGKLGVDDRTEAVILALRRGVIHLDE